MPTNTAVLKTFAQQTRAKLISLIATKLQFLLNADSAELRGAEAQIDKLRREIERKTEKNVVEEVAYTWFNRVMALRFMDANGYNAPMIVSPTSGQTRPEILQDAMGGTIDEELQLSDEDRLLPEAKLYRRILIAVCNRNNKTMPFLFERIADYTELLLPDDLLSEQSFVTDIRRGMTDEDCQNVELMGWLYQFYITDRKADAEVKKSKKGGLKSDEQAAATQLFTPHWVVRYMVENTLGKIWMTLHPESRLIDEMPYYISTPEGQTDTIPEDIHSASDIKFIDPCMGSGHVLVYAFDLFCKMYEEEGVLHKDIPALILNNNIFGIDIDSRCYQLASFALTMKARAYYSRYMRHTVIPNVIALQNIDRDTIASAGNWDKKSLMWQFENIDTIGSLLKITPEETAAIHVEEGLFGANQQLLRTQAEYLSKKYHCVVTNPPYLGKGFCDALKNYLQKEYPNSKTDTMATFMERCLEFTSANGKMAMINMHSWMFLSSYEKLRGIILDQYNIDSLLHLGPRTFDEISGEVVQNAAFVIANHIPNELGGIYYRLVAGNNCHSKEMMFLKPEDTNTETVEKEQVYFPNVSQKDFKNIPGSPIGYWASPKIQEIFTSNLALSAVCSPTQGLATADNARFLRLWFEVAQSRIGFGFQNAASAARSQKKWFPYNKGGGFRKWYGNQENVVNWENDGEEIKSYNGAVIRNPNYYFRSSVSWGLIASTSTSFRMYPAGFIYDVGGMSLFANDGINKSTLIGSLNTKLFLKLVKVINPTINMQCGDVARTPHMNITDENTQFDVGKLADNNISISKLDWDAHETSWDFQSNEIVSLDSEQKYIDTINAIYEGTGILVDLAAPELGSLAWRVDLYKQKWEDKFHRLHANEEELNRRFIEIYGLQDELTPDVPLDEITILQKGEIDIVGGEIVWNEDVVIKQLISYLVGCFMGRYSIDKPGLIIASQNQDLSTLGVKVNGIDNGAPGRIEIDDDGVVPVLAEEYFPDDMTVRIEQAIKTMFGDEHFQTNLRYIDEKLGKPLREYLFKDFFNDHIDGKMYQKRPIYWMFSSKMGDKRRKGYFKALIYMHRMENDTLSKLHADYVVPYIAKIEQQHIEAEDLSLRDDISQAQRNKARKSADEYADQLRELKDFEQVLVQMASQRLSIDLDDGVRANYPKFYPLVEPIKGLDKDE